MSDNKTKTLMPEVLPTPNQAPTSDARARVTARMRKLVKQGLAVGTAAACMSCVACDPLPEPCNVDAGTGNCPPPTDGGVGSSSSSGGSGGGSSSTGSGSSGP